VPRKRKFNKSTGRKYTGNSYDAKYGRRTSKQRSERNKARRIVFNRLAKKHGKAKARQMMKGKDVAHKNGLSNNPSNLKLSSPSKNRGRRGEGNRKKGKRS
jgi:hypothetical protein